MKERETEGEGQKWEGEREPGRETRDRRQKKREMERKFVIALKEILPRVLWAVNMLHLNKYQLCGIIAVPWGI